MSGVETIYPGASLAAGGGSGDVVGPASSIDGELVLFDGTTGALLKGGGVPSVYLGAMTWAELQASEYANGSVGLAALDADASVTITGWAQPVVMVPNADKTYWQGSNGFFPIYKAGLSSLNSVTGCNAAITWTLAADPSNGKTRITASGAHGWTSAVNGKCADITAWSGTGAAGLYELTYVDGTNMDLSVTYNAGYGNPTVSPINTEVVLRTLSMPAALMQAQSQQRITTVWRLTSSSNSHYCIVRMGATAYLYVTPSSVTGYHDVERLISNIGSVSSQVGQKSDSSPSGGGALATSSIDTSATFDIKPSGRTNTVNEYVELLHYTIEVCV